jgi:hypothetical protein
VNNSRSRLCLTLGLLALIGCNSTRDSLLKLVDRVPQILRVGLGDHIRCAILNIPKPGAADPNDSIEPLNVESQQLVDSIKTKLPDGYQIAGAHHCRFEGRRVIHVAIQARSGVASVVIVGKKPGESLDDMPKDPYVRASVDPYQLAVLSTKDHLVFVVSEEGRAKNEALLTAISPSLRSFLEHLSD